MTQTVNPPAETATLTDVQVRNPSPTLTISYLPYLLEGAGSIRTQAKVLVERAQELQRDVFVAALIDKATAECSRRSMQSLLDELASAGFAWRDIAQLVGVSVAAVQKWRSGGGADPSHRLSLASLAALSELLARQFSIEDPAGWLQMPLRVGMPVTGFDLLVNRRIDLLLRWAGHSDLRAETILDEFDPAWRDRYKTDYEVFTAADGLPAIRLRNE